MLNGEWIPPRLLNGWNQPSSWLKHSSIDFVISGGMRIKSFTILDMLTDFSSKNITCFLISRVGQICSIWTLDLLIYNITLKKMNDIFNFVCSESLQHSIIICILKFKPFWNILYQGTIVNIVSSIFNHNSLIKFLFN